MRIGILGSGLMGGKLGTLFARAGHEVVFSYAHQSFRTLSARSSNGNYPLSVLLAPLMRDYGPGLNPGRVRKD